MTKSRVGFVVVALAVVPAHAQHFRARDHRALFDEATRCVVFEIEFTLTPDFYTLDPQENQAESFQFHLDTQPGNNGWGGTSPYPWETIVRGSEIHKEGDVPVRDHTGAPSSSPASGGWGRVAGAVPYDLAGVALEFTVPYAVLGTTSGRFGYALELYRYGQWTGITYSGSSAPIPAPAWTPVLALAGMAAAGRRRRPVG